MKGDAVIDAVHRGQAFGNVAHRLLANGMNVNSLRTNTLLRKDEWKQMDEVVVETSKQRLVGVADLVSRGLTLNLANGLGTTVLEYEKEGDMSDADVNMLAEAPPTKDKVPYTPAYLPLPIVHKGFDISIRTLEASRRLGTPLDTTLAAIAARKVAEKIESILFTGASTYTFGGGVLYGYLDFPQANAVNLHDAWDDSANAGVGILNDVIALKSASIADRHHGPWMLYVPTLYDAVLDDDFKTNSDLSIRERLKMVDGISDIRVADKLTADRVVLVEMSPDTVRLVIGLQPTTVEWESQGGMMTHYKVMSIMVPQLRADADGRCGIVVGSGS